MNCRKIVLFTSSTLQRLQSLLSKDVQTVFSFAHLLTSLNDDQSILFGFFYYFLRGASSSKPPRLFSIIDLGGPKAAALVYACEGERIYQLARRFHRDRRKQAGPVSVRRGKPPRAETTDRRGKRRHVAWDGRVAPAAATKRPSLHSPANP